MTIASSLGFPRIGPDRELKKAVEAYWSGKSTREALLAAGAEIRAENWRLQKRAGIEHIPSNDFSFYDQVLDTTAMLGAIPARFGGGADLDICFNAARGVKPAAGVVVGGIPAMEMTKWFDTNYHYIVPEFSEEQRFSLASTKPVDEFLEAKALGIHTRPVLIGPVTYLLLGKARTPGLRPLDLLDGLLPVYEEVLRRLDEAGADWVQIDEPCLALDLSPEARAAYTRAYTRLAGSRLRILLATYFGGLGDNLPLAAGLPVAALHVDLVRDQGQLDAVLAALPSERSLSIGVIDGRNIWRADLDKALATARRVADRLGPERLLVAPSCSLLHSPVDLAGETKLDEELRSWLAFAAQKLAEVGAVARGVRNGDGAIAADLAASRAARDSRAKSARIHRPDVQARAASVTEAMLRRAAPFTQRRAAQREALRLPPLPTTTIGSFPQTPEVRAARAAFTSGKIDRAEYENRVRGFIRECIAFQEEIGIDVLVHGEFERNDMVEYFGEQLDGYAFTRNGWVQSYGSRCVKPPIIFGDVRRPRPMTVEWSAFAQSLSKRPVKGMLTGPITILQWSFVRDDQPRSETARQIALAIRDEVLDLEKAGLRVIQIDEPAIREGLPLRRAEHAAYLRWAVDCFRLASAGVKNETQVHTHMCYSEFGEIIESVAALDADVISIESSRSDMELLRAFTAFRYPNEIGPGVYDIHSPRVPTVEEVRSLLSSILKVLPAEQVWVNPDCGLKTRRWEEVRPALANMVEAARSARAGHGHAPVEPKPYTPAAAL